MCLQQGDLHVSMEGIVALGDSHLFERQTKRLERGLQHVIAMCIAGQHNAVIGNYPRFEQFLLIQRPFQPETLRVRLLEGQCHAERRPYTRSGDSQLLAQAVNPLLEPGAIVPYVLSHRFIAVDLHGGFVMISS